MIDVAAVDRCGMDNEDVIPGSSSNFTSSIETSVVVFVDGVSNK